MTSLAETLPRKSPGADCDDCEDIAALGAAHLGFSAATCPTRTASPASAG